MDDRLRDVVRRWRAEPDRADLAKIAFQGLRVIGHIHLGMMKVLLSLNHPLAILGTGQRPVAITFDAIDRALPHLDSATSSFFYRLAADAIRDILRDIEDPERAIGTDLQDGLVLLTSQGLDVEAGIRESFARRLTREMRPWASENRTIWQMHGVGSEEGRTFHGRDLFEYHKDRDLYLIDVAAEWLHYMLLAVEPRDHLLRLFNTHRYLARHEDKTIRDRLRYKRQRWQARRIGDLLIGLDDF